MRRNQDFKKEIVMLLSCGYTVKYIASSLNMSSKTLESDIDHMKKEYDCVSITHLVATYLRLKLIK